MGRLKKVLSEAEKAERKERWFGTNRNARRRAKYQEDGDFREKEKERARVVSREPGATAANNPLTNVSRIGSFGEKRTVVMPGGRVEEMVCLTTNELGPVLFKSVHILYRWRQAGKLPKPVLATKAGVDVYSVQEVRQIVRILGEHLTKTPYFHNSHTKTAKDIQTAVDGIRVKEGYYNAGNDQNEGAALDSASAS